MAFLKDVPFDFLGMFEVIDIISNELDHAFRPIEESIHFKIQVEAAHIHIRCTNGGHFMINDDDFAMHKTGLILINLYTGL